MIKLLTPKQFFAYCERNNIHSIVVEISYYDYNDEVSDTHVYLSESAKHQTTRIDLYAEFTAVKTYDIYEAFKIFPPDVITDITIFNMRDKCPSPAFFMPDPVPTDLLSDLPF